MTTGIPNHEQESVLQGNENNCRTYTTTPTAGTGIITEQPIEKFSILGPPPPYTERQENGFDSILLAEANNQMLTNIQENPENLEEKKRRRNNDTRDECYDCWGCCCCEACEEGASYAVANTVANSATSTRHHTRDCCACEGDCCYCCPVCVDCGCGDGCTCDCGDCSCADCNCGDCGDCNCGNCNCGDCGSCGDCSIM